LEVNLAVALKRQLAAEVVEVEHSMQPCLDAVPDRPVEEPPREKLDTKDHDDKAGARLRSGTTNRRRQARYACRLGAEVYQQGSSVRNYCQLSDLSPGGCYLEMPLAFPTGTAVEITVRTQEMKLRLSGEVRASHPGYGMSISFTLNSKDERHGVQQLIDFVAAAAESSS
jgi:hypothetical protein